MTKIRLLFTADGAGLGERVATALAEDGYQLSFGAADPNDPDDAAPAATIVIWTAGATTNPELVDCARLEKAARRLVPVSVGAGAVPVGFETLSPMNLMGWAGDRADPRWRFILEEVSLAAGDDRMVSVLRAASREATARAPLAAPARRSDEGGMFEGALTAIRGRPAIAAAGAAGLAATLAVAAFGVGLMRAPSSPAPETVVADAAAETGAPTPMLSSVAPVADPATDPATDPVADPLTATVVEGAPLAEEEATDQFAAAEVDAGLIPSAQVGGENVVEIASDTDESQSATPPAPVESADETAEGATARAIEAAAAEDDDPIAQLAWEATSEPQPTVAEAVYLGNYFKECVDCPDMAALPAGVFMFGARTGERLAADEERPQREISLPGGVAIGTREITFEQWDACARDGGCRGYRPSDAGWGRGRRPAINVSYADAVAYTEWLSARTGSRYRLPSEAEWEFAARAGAAGAFSFGDAVSTKLANFHGEYPYGAPRGEFRGMTLPVGSLVPNAYGLYDMHGNVWEWTADCWSENHAAAPANGAPVGGECSRRVAKGGAWNTGGWRLRAAHRAPMAAGARSSDLGFRVVRDLP